MARQKESKFRSQTTADAERQQSNNTGFGYLNLPRGIKVFSAPPGGKVVMDIIPYTVSDEHHPDRDADREIAIPGELWYKRPFKTHRNIGASKDSYICPTSIGKKCPICEYRAKRKEAGASKEELDALNAKTRNLYVVKIIGHKDFDETFMVWDISQFLFQEKLNEELSENLDYGVFPDLEQGMSLRIRFESKKFGTGKPFADTSRIDFIERAEQYDESVLDEIPNLDEIMKVLSYKELDAKFQELDENDIASADDAIVETHSRRKKDDDDVKKPAKKADPEPDNDLTWEDLEAKSQKALLRMNDDEDLGIQEDDFEDVEELRVLVAKKLRIAIPKSKPSKKDDPDDDDEKPASKKGFDNTGTHPKNMNHPDNKASRGSKPESKNDPDDDEKPASRRRTEPESKGKCPKGHIFGKDCDKFPKDCDSCAKWDECMDAQDAMK
jgi:hypothetical protein